MTGIMQQFAPLRLELLCPVHIGTGETLDPLSYVMREEGGEPFLYYVDTTAWIEAQPDPARLARDLDQATLPTIRGWLKDIDPTMYGTSRVKVVSTAIYDHYKDELSRQTSEHQLKISPALRNPVTGGLLIPGSSLKGAMRTAVIDHLDDKYGLDLKGATRQGPQAYVERLEDALGPIDKNDFRNLRVGDFEARLDESALVTAKEVRRTYDPNKSPTPKNDCEVALGRIMDQEGHDLYGRLLLGARGGGAADAVFSLRRKKINETWSLQGFMDLVNAFYRQRYIEEKAKFYGLAHLKHVAEALKAVEDAILNPGRGVMVLRVGHYSHVECVTVTDNAPFTRRIPDTGEFYPHGTTRTLAHGRYPFGWIRIVECGMEEYEQGLRDKRAHDEALLDDRRRKRLEALAKAEGEARRREERRDREQKELETEERRRAELEALPPDERLVVLLEAGGLIENGAVQLYQRIDDLEEGLRTRAARGLKAFWQGRGKWEPNQCTKKQGQKVAKIKSILGE